jgi:hypothetical protein
MISGMANSMIGEVQSIPDNFSDFDCGCAFSSDSMEGGETSLLLQCIPRLESAFAFALRYEPKTPSESQCGGEFSISAFAFPTKSETAVEAFPVHFGPLAEFISMAMCMSRLNS